jgi:hypothetical protein
MFLDKLGNFSASQAITADARSTNVVDLLSIRQIGVGAPVWVVFNIEVAADHTTGDETYQFNVETDDNSSFSSSTILASRAIAAATLLAGYTFAIAVPMQNMERYISAFYDVGGTTPTVTVSAYLTNQEPSAWTGYAAGTTVAV